MLNISQLQEVSPADLPDEEPALKPVGAHPLDRRYTLVLRARGSPSVSPFLNSLIRPSTKLLLTIINETILGPQTLTLQMSV